MSSTERTRVDEYIKKANALEEEITWTPCLKCGKKVPSPMDFCSTDCNDEYHGRKKRHV